MSQYFTTLGKTGRGFGFNKTYHEAIKYLADIFQRAAEEKLDVYMACGSVCEELRDKKYYEVVKRTFADSVEAVLKNNRNVYLFIWGNPSDEDISPSLKRLMAKCASKRPVEWGRFSVIVSGESVEPDDALHFVVAKSRDNQRWITRIEERHAKPTQEQIRTGKFEVPALILFDSEEAKIPGEKLVRGFAVFSGENDIASRIQGASAGTLPETLRLTSMG